uniref:Uncharacterized protein n=1 Tax=Oryza punctata TaxID=4537 RepID=A0A0E0KJ57_ORYPU
MAAPRPLPSWNESVPQLRFAGEPTAEEGWVPVKCKTKKSEGCREYGCLMVEGQTLCARLANVHPDCTILSVHADERFHRSMLQEQLEKLVSELGTSEKRNGENSESSEKRRAYRFSIVGRGRTARMNHFKIYRFI